MSTFFAVRNPDLESPMTLREALLLGDKLEVYQGPSEDSENFEEEYSKLLGSPIPPEDSAVLLGIKGLAVRGFYFAYQDGIYIASINTPSTIGDWESILSFVMALARKFNTTIGIGDGKTFEGSFTPEMLPGMIDWKGDIREGVEAVNQYLSAETPTVALLGIKRTMFINREMFNGVMAASDPILAFSQLCTRLQYPQAYIPEQILTQDNGEIFGYYVLNEGLPTLLPHGKPTLDYKYQAALGDEKVRWHLIFMTDKVDAEGRNVYLQYPYETFLAGMPPDVWTALDAECSIVRAVSLEEMKEFFKEIEP